MEEPPANINSKPTSTSTTIIGIIHHNFLCQRNDRSSLNILTLETALLMVIFLS